MLLAPGTSTRVWIYTPDGVKLCLTRFPGQLLYD
jgi:hypothetical protein